MNLSNRQTSDLTFARLHIFKHMKYSWGEQISYKIKIYFNIQILAMYRLKWRDRPYSKYILIT